jgi:hypothetical protein
VPSSYERIREKCVKKTKKDEKKIKGGAKKGVF